MAQQVARLSSHRIIVQPKIEAKQEQIERMLGNRRILKHLNANRQPSMRVIQADSANDASEMLHQFRQSGLVEFAEPDYPLRASVLPNDPHFQSGMQWPLNSSSGKNIKAVEAWDVTNSANNVIVAVVDSGIRYTHEDLAGNMWRNAGEIPDNNVDDDGNGLVDDVYGINAVAGNGNPMDDAGHGTHVAGIIGAVGNNGKGIAGVAWNIKLMACKFLDSDGYGYTSDAVEAIDYARRMGAKVINASFGGDENSNALLLAIQNARNAGIIFVAAAGNEQRNIDQYPTYPASYSVDNMVVVGGSSRSDTVDTFYSNFGIGDVDLFAPGTSVYSTWFSTDSAYRSETGTSMAAPHVAGAVALMRARFPNFTYSQIISRLLSTVDTSSAFSSVCKSGGRLNLARALGPDPLANFSASAYLGQPPLSVNFTDNSIGSVQSYSWDFGDGTPASTEANPSHVFTLPGTYNVRLTIVGTNGRSDTQTQTVRVIENYRFTSEPYAWITPTGMTRLTLADNGVSAAQSLPFSFNFYGVAQSSIFVGANGNLSFAADGLANRDNVAMPNGAAPNALIAPFWDDLNPSAAGAAVYVGTVGSTPNRRFVVTWQNVPRVANSALMSFQAILEEGSGEMVFQYRTVDGGRSATIGVENLSGDVAAMYAHNGSPSLVANGSALRIGRPAFRHLLVAQSSLSLNFTQGGASPSATLDLENGGNTSLSWTVNSPSSWLNISAGSGSLASGEKKQLQVQLTAAALALAPGVHQTTLEVANTSDGAGNVTLPVTIQVEAGISTLEFTPGIEVEFTGGLGGPFSPSSIEVQLRNSGSTPLSWSSTTTNDWAQATPASGQLSAGQSVTVLVGLSTDAALRSEGVYDGIIQFVNDDAPDTQQFTQALHLRINARLESSSIDIRNGKFSAQIAAPKAGGFAVEYSTDLVNWERLTTGATQNGAVSFEDAITPGTFRFYRLRSL